ncbi:MAG: glycosyltransferase family 39 protein [Candidatus Hinthialibacter antarcticus]|nr:glycosyltransferase family 39 protein [Candidatus Hinthialibacter antarcticus]
MIELSIFLTAIAFSLYTVTYRIQAEQPVAHKERVVWIQAIGFALLGTLPFLNKPFHIDDTVVLEVARNVLNNPLRPFGSNFDWFGELQPLWQVTTNPPFLSYCLAPFVWMSSGDEVALHAVMSIFIFCLAVGAVLLSKRFCADSIWPAAFLLASPAVVVSGNVMRDVPAVGLSTLGVALFVMGVDKEQRRWLIAGAVLCGLSVLTKYSAVITLPVLFLYPLLQKKYRLAVWIWPAVAIIVLWCLQNVFAYGSVHIIYLLLERRSESGISWQDKLYGAFLVIGSVLYLLPALLVRAVGGRDWTAWIGAVLLAPLWWLAINQYLGEVENEYLLWALSGSALLFILLFDGIRVGSGWIKQFEPGKHADSLFLFAWVCAPLVFCVLFVPFEAVRHLLPVLPPLVLLAARYLNETKNKKLSSAIHFLVAILFAVQFFAAQVIQRADYEYAATYRNFAVRAQEEWLSDEHETWYVGHWGWQEYANRAGLRQMRLGEFPNEGDVLIVPYRVDKGRVFEQDRDYLSRQELVDEVTYEGYAPVRTQNFWGAGFYSTISLFGHNIPYRIMQDEFLESFEVYRIANPEPVVAEE